MTLREQLTLLAVLLLMSKGAAGVTGSGFIVLAATLSVVGKVPVGGLALILGIDRFMSEARAITNVIGNGVASIVVSRWTGDLDSAILDRQLSPETYRPPAPMKARFSSLRPIVSWWKSTTVGRSSLGDSYIRTDL
jgi:aerobic C4-dicarboxylate transport protein